MPAMTMVFRAKEPAMLDQVKMGDKISFVADKIGGQLTVTQVQVKN
jgi:Cu/Ag efflux protein CusF